MIYRENNQWNLPKFKLLYTESNKELERYTSDKDYWLSFADKWDHFEIIKFEDVEYTNEQLSRFEKIKNMPEDFGNKYSDYVINGVFDTDKMPGNHLFNIMKLESEKEVLEGSVMELTSFLVGGFDV